MFEHILLPVDLSENNGATLDAAAELAQMHGASVTLLHVIEAIEDVPSEELEDFYSELTRNAQVTLLGWAERLSGKGLEVDIRIATGRRAREIVEQAERESCDLIVMATHHVDTEHPAGGVGTISHQVAMLAPCAVMLVR